MHDMGYPEHLVKSANKILGTKDIDNDRLVKYFDLLELFNFNLYKPKDVIYNLDDKFIITDYGKEILAKSFNDNLLTVKIMGMIFLILAAFINHETDFCNKGVISKDNPYICMFKSFVPVMPVLIVYFIVSFIQEPDNYLWSLLTSGCIGIFVTGLIFLVQSMTTNQKNFIHECFVAGIGGLIPFILMYSTRMNGGESSWTNTNDMIKKLSLIFVTMYTINWVLQFSGLQSFIFGENTGEVTYQRVRQKTITESESETETKKKFNKNIVLVPQSTLALHYQKGWLISLIAVGVLCVLYYCWNMGSDIYSLPEYQNNNMRTVLFILEMAVFGLGSTAPYLYAAKNRTGRITSTTLVESAVLIGKYSIMHIILQFTGFYGSLGL